MATNLNALVDKLPPEKRDFLLREVVMRSYDARNQTGVWCFVQGYMADAVVERIRAEAGGQ